MAINLDRNLLEELGLGTLPENEKGALLTHIYETLEMRVGMRLADQMTNEQLDEFEKYFEAKDDAGAFHWLETNFPNYKDIVQDEFNKLKEEVRQSAPQILQASQAQAAAGAVTQTPPPAVDPLSSPQPQYQAPQPGPQQPPVQSPYQPQPQPQAPQPEPPQQPQDPPQPPQSPTGGPGVPPPSDGAANSGGFPPAPVQQ